MKLFDYKFLITLGLSLVVYFLYREVDILNKRVATLEKGDKVEKNTNKPKKLIELPPLPNNDLVEEYSNEEIEHKDNISIYSHDNLETNSNEHDSLMVESILNMVRAETPNKKTSSSSSKHSELSEPSEHSEILRESNVSSVSSESSVSSKSSKLSKSSNLSISAKIAEMIKSNTSDDNDDNNDIELVKNIVFSLDALNKKKLDELQDLALKYNIDINENGKKKKKAVLAQEIFNKQ